MLDGDLLPIMTEPLVISTEPLLLRAEPLVISTEPLVISTEPLLLRAEPLLNLWSFRPNLWSFRPNHHLTKFSTQRSPCSAPNTKMSLAKISTHKSGHKALPSFRTEHKNVVRSDLNTKKSNTNSNTKISKLCQRSAPNTKMSLDKISTHKSGIDPLLMPCF